MFMETSAKAGHNVKSLFKKIAMSLVGMEKENEQSEAQNTSASPLPVLPAYAYSTSMLRDRCHITIAKRGARCVTVSMLSSPRRDRAYYTSPLLYAFLHVTIPPTSCTLCHLFEPGIWDVVVPTRLCKGSSITTTQV